MIIDSHTHVFPDALAPRAIASLQASADAGTGIKNCLPAHTDGTLDGLKRSMVKNGIDASIVLPVVTKPSQFETVNVYASEINGKDGIYSFGGIHPDCEDIEDKLSFIKSLGLRGIKLHPAYQRCYINDQRYIRIVKKCLELGLYMIFHSGYDIAYPDYTPCTPKLFYETFASLLKEYGEEKEPHVILAHLGGVMELEETKKYLMGLPVYLDLAYTLEQIDARSIMEIINAHGADRILFASDSPWQDQGACAKRFDLLPLTDEQRELILHKNAERILGL